jgi:hypothetical protein
VSFAPFSLQQPLVSRPAYGQVQEEDFAEEWEGPELLGAGPLSPSGQNTAASPVAESGLPKGDPGGKGISLNPEIPGESTYNKPVDDIRQPDKAGPGSIYRIDGPDDLAKPQDDEKQDQRQHQNFKPRFEGPGPKGEPVVTDYPYRDGLPHQHYASVAFVAGEYLVAGAHELRVVPGNRLIIASKPDDVVMGLNPKFRERAQSCGVILKRADIGNMRWLFSVNCGNVPRVVKLKAFRSANVIRLGKMDIDVACSCPAWQWLGPEHHAQTNDYLDGSPRGTASVPVIRDPQGINRVCKHVAAVLTNVQGWEIPAKPKKK